MVSKIRMREEGCIDYSLIVNKIHARIRIITREQGGTEMHFIKRINFMQKFKRTHLVTISSAKSMVTY
jgi:L-fucose mutarotase/ribose pyranase (RbsD/FucU family)